MAIWLLQIPLTLGFATYGLGIIGIIIVESLILAQREQISFGKAIWLSFLANLCSLILGIYFIWGLSALPYEAIGGQMLGLSYLLLVIFSSSLFPLKQSEHFRIHPFLLKILSLFGWGLIWFCGLLYSILLLPADFSIPTPFYIKILQFLAVAIFIGIGFAISVVVEGFCLKKLMPDRSGNLIKTILIMNVRSYSYIAIPITLVFMIFTKGITSR